MSRGLSGGHASFKDVVGLGLLDRRVCFGILSKNSSGCQNEVNLPADYSSVVRVFYILINIRRQITICRSMGYWLWLGFHHDVKELESWFCTRAALEACGFLGRPGPRPSDLWAPSVEDSVAPELWRISRVTIWWQKLNYCRMESGDHIPFQD